MDVFVLWYWGFGGFKIGLEDLFGFEGLEAGLCGSVPFWDIAGAPNACAIPSKKPVDPAFLYYLAEKEVPAFSLARFLQHNVLARGCGCFGVSGGL